MLLIITVSSYYKFVIAAITNPHGNNSLNNAIKNLITFMIFPPFKSQIGVTRLK